MQYQIKLPFPLPTWNRLLGANRWQRKKIRDIIHKMVFKTINEQRITKLELREYIHAIRPKKVQKVRRRKRS